MDDGLQSDDSFVSVFDSGSNNQATEALVSGMLAGLQYRFRLLARDVNGLGDPGPELLMWACVPPGDISMPLLVSNTRQTI